MGASIKRRESRKQKFSSLPPETIVQKEELVQRMTVDHQQAPDDTNALQTRNATESDGEQSSEAEPLKKNEEESTKHRFICFIGNLPFTATTQSIADHFAAVKPSHIRHSTEKSTGKSRGFAFLEFDAFNRMQSCIMQYHHSSFPDTEGTARKINVELTVGGGANSKRRKAKIYEKNEKLDNERRERRRKRVRTNLRHKQSTKAREGSLAPEEADIHPSRRKAVAH
ncbi:hypothetical protein MMC10_008517 [Thelotrema lepadinum]|nr:hypothetical protein [Thelotrema lepadinum]